MTPLVCLGVHAYGVVDYEFQASMETEMQWIYHRACTDHKWKKRSMCSSIHVVPVCYTMVNSELRNGKSCKRHKNLRGISNIKIIHLRWNGM